MHIRTAALVRNVRHLVRKERYGEAIACLDQAILLEPECAAHPDARGVLLSLLGKEQEALASFAHAVSLAKTRQQQALIYYHRGLLYGRQKAYDQALLDFKRAQRLDPATQTYREAREQLQRDASLARTSDVRNG